MPNDDYIKRSEAIKHINAWVANYVDMRTLGEVISDIPAADVEPVRYGRWVYKMRELIRYEKVNGTDPLGGVQTVTVKTHIRGPVPYCSLCDALAADSFLDYCPRCGAKMDKDKEK